MLPGSLLDRPLVLLASAGTRQVVWSPPPAGALATLGGLEGLTPCSTPPPVSISMELALLVWLCSVGACPEEDKELRPAWSWRGHKLTRVIDYPRVSLHIRALWVQYRCTQGLLRPQRTLLRASSLLNTS